MTSSRRSKDPQSGNALVTVLITSVALIALAGATMTFSRTDTMVSQNTTHSVEALWAAQAGVEVAKLDLIQDYETLLAAPTPRTATGTVGNASYSVTWQPYPNATPAARFQIDSTATGPDMTSQAVREVVATAQLDLNLDAISIHGSGSHTKLENNNGLIPNFTIDGRNHDIHGDPYDAANNPVTCPLTVAAVAADTAGANSVQDEINGLRCELVKEANACCDAGGNDTCGGPRDCSPGQWWIRGTDPGPRFTANSPCTTGNFTELDLDDPLLRFNDPANFGMPVITALSPAFFGPMTDDPLDGASDSPTFIKTLDTTGLNNLNNQITAILDYAIRAPASQKVCASSSISSGTTTFGSLIDPKIVVVPKSSHSDARYIELRNQTCGAIGGPANFNINGGAAVVGYGILILPRSVILDGGNAATPTRFSWSGIVVVLDDGDLRLGTGGNSEHVCGGILGGVILKDDSGSDPKMNFLDVGNHTCTNPFWVDHTATDAWATTTAQDWFGFSVKYSCESIRRALGAGLGTLAWTQRFQGE